MRKFIRRFAGGIMAAAMAASLLSVSPKVTVEAEDTWEETTLITNGDFANGEEGWTINMPDAADNDNVGYEIQESSVNNNSKYLLIYNNQDATTDFTATNTIEDLEAGTYKLSFKNTGYEWGASGLTITIGTETSKATYTHPKLSGWDVWSDVTDMDSFTISETTDVKLTISGTLNTWAKDIAFDDFVLSKKVVAGGSEEEPRTFEFDTSPLEGDKIESDLVVDKVDGLAKDFITGFDISSYRSIKNSGGKYYGFDGKELSDEGFFKLLKDNGVNYVRIRVWVDPFDENNNGYGGGNCTIDTAEDLGLLATKAGMRVLVDFHYSDFWTDPGKYSVPKSWREEDTISEKADRLQYYTEDCLAQLLDAGVDVGMVQVGNETTTGFCGETNWKNMCELFNAGSQGIRNIEEQYEKDIMIAVHFTNPESGNFGTFAKNLKNNKVIYDVFATSYYPYWHGTLENLTNELQKISDDYGKYVMVAETSYARTYEDGDGHTNTVYEGSPKNEIPYDISEQGQVTSVRKVVQAVADVKNNKGIGVFYWEPAWIPVNNVNKAADKKAAIEDNKKLWEKYGSGWASSYSKDYDSDAGEWFGGSAVDNEAVFDFDGKALDTLKIFNMVRYGTTANNYVIKVINPEKTFEFGKKITLPEKISVVYANGNTDELNVEWNSEELDAAKENGIGYYEIKGAASFGGKDLEPVCKLTISHNNLLINGSFEDEISDADWKLVGIERKNAKDNNNNMRTGDYNLHFNQTDNHSFYQTVNLNKGVYVAGGYVSGEASTYNIDFYTRIGESGEKQTKSASLKGWKNWDNPEFGNIEINEDNTAFTLGVDASNLSGDVCWGAYEDFYLYKLTDAEVNEVSAVEALINELDPISLSKAEDVANARKAYNDLSDVAKSAVTNLDVLEKAEDDLAKLQAAEVDKLISDIGNVTLASENAINAARTALDKLSDAAKAYVSKENFLKNAEDELANLKEKDAKAIKDAEKVDNQIEAIGEIKSLDQKTAVEEARKALEALSEEAKAKIKNEDKLKEAEAAIKKLEKEKKDAEDKKKAAEEAVKEAAENADMYINAIGTITTLNSKATVEYARKVYDALTAEEKALVKNYDKLVAAEKAIEQLVFEATPATEEEQITETVTNSEYKVTKTPEYKGAVGTVTYVAPADKKATTVTIPATITYHGETFKVTAIAANAFKGNKNIKSVTIGSNVSNIGKKAFYNCKNLSKITIKTSKLKTSTVGANAFKGIKKTATIKVPSKKLKAYKKLLKKKGVTSKAKIKK